MHFILDIALLLLFARLSVSTSAVRSQEEHSKAFDWNRIKYVYAFGDSYTFVQGTAGHANFSFIGDASNPSFTPHELITDEIIPRNTSSEGSNWIEFLTGCFEGSPSKCKRQLWNFAFAGADIDGKLLPLHHNFTVPLVDQVNQWTAFASDILPHSQAETLTAWWIGINDTGDTVTNSSITNFTAFWETEMTSYFKAVQQAADHGLRAHLFINVPPEDRSPATIGDAVKVALMKEHISLFNSVLEQHIVSFEKANPGVVVLSFDANAWFNMVLDSPAKFGFSNVTGFCTCANPEGFFWFNSGHPTERVHKLLAEAVEAKLHAS